MGQAQNGKRSFKSSKTTTMTGRLGRVEKADSHSALIVLQG
jgi:hypothetical protein